MRNAFLLLLPLLMAMNDSHPSPAATELDAWVGNFAMELRVASVAKLPLMPSEQSVTASLLLVEIGRRAEGLIQRHRVCDVRVDGSSPVRMVVPPEFVRGLAPREYEAHLDPAVGGRGGWGYRADLGLEAIGFDPELTGGELPRGPDDPAVRDSDDDGRLGATVELRLPAIGRVQLFIAQRSHLVLHATDAQPDRTEGTVEIRFLEQRTLGAQPGFFNRTPDLRPDPEHSGFTLVRLPEGADCDTLRAAAPKLFGWA